MGRSKRITLGGYAYHVLNRANGRLRLIAWTKWSIRRYMDMQHLHDWEKEKSEKEKQTA